MTLPPSEFKRYLDALRTRLGREHRAPTREEWLALRSRHAAWARWTAEDIAIAAGVVGVRTGPRPWHEFEWEFGTEPPASSEPEPTPVASSTRPPLPPDTNLFMFTSIQKAVRMFDEDASVNAVARDTIFTTHDATKIHRMWQDGFLKLNGKRSLVVNGRVGHTGKRYALRVWDDRHGRWVDPVKGAPTPG